MKETKLKSKSMALVGMMGALANVLALISILIGRIAPQVAFDLSNLAVVVMGFYGGWRLGALTGFIGGFTPGIYFGPMGLLGLPGLFSLMIGKALTGLTVGLLAKLIEIQRRKRTSLLAVPTVLLGYLPEFAFTVFWFLIVVPLYLPSGIAVVAIAYFPAIAIKAWAEMILISFFTSAFAGNVGLNRFMDRYLGS